MRWNRSPFGKLRSEAARRAKRVPLRVELIEERVVPTVVVNGTNAADLITSDFFFDSTANSYRGEVKLNGAVVYSFLGDLYTSPAPSIYLPEPLAVNGLGGNDRIDLSALRDPFGQASPITVHGGTGNDTVIGSYGHDLIYGDAGADSLNGGVDEDTLVGDDADVSFVGGGGIDVLKFENYSGSLQATPTLLNMNGNRLTAASGRFVQIAAFDVTGSNGADSIDLSQFPSFLANVNGRGGADTIRVDAERGLIDGGGGDLIVYASANPQGMSILGGSGDDTIRVNAAFASVDGGAGADTIDGRGIGANYLNLGLVAVGGPGADVIYGSDFVDNLDGGDGDDRILGGASNDVLTGGLGADSITGGNDGDTFYVDGDDARWAGGLGVDSVYVTGNFRNVVVTNTSASFNGNSVGISGLEMISVVGTPLNDVLDASRFGGYVNLTGLEGNDVLRAGSGGSYLDGGDGNDQLFGGSSDDVLIGAAGADRMSAGAGADQLTGDIDDALIQAGPGTDYLGFSAVGQNITAADHSVTVDGKSLSFADAEFVGYFLAGTTGNDTLDAVGYTQSLTYASDAGDDVIRTGPGDDTIDAGPGNDFVDAGGGADVIFGGDGLNTLLGGEGNDVLYGGFDADLMDGGGGGDVLHGAYQDVLLGGAGDDTIYATTQTSSIDAGAGADYVTVAGAFGSNVILTDASWNNSGSIVPLAGIELFDMTTGIFDDTVDASAFTGYLSLTDSGGFNLVKAGSGGSGIYIRGNPDFDFVYSSTVIGGAGPDTIYADTGHNFFYGMGGADNLSTAFGSSYLDGGADNDFISGGQGVDTVIGGAGDDDLRGGAGVDSILGGAGADLFYRDVDPDNAAQEALVWDVNPGEGDVVADLQ